MILQSCIYLEDKALHNFWDKLYDSHILLITDLFFIY